MESIFLRCTAASMISIILILALRGKHGEIATVLSLTCCCVVAISAMAIISPLLDFLRELQNLSRMDTGMTRILFKIVGVGLIGELAGAVCSDSGNAAIGKTVQIAATALILYLSLPLFTSLLELLERIMGSV